MKKFNRNYFKCIDSPEKAYILGFFYADGYNSGTQVEFDQLDQDSDILEAIRKELDCDEETKISQYVQATNGKIKDRLVFSSVDMCKDLNKLGAPKNKSLTLTFPTSDIVPKEYLNHFIRGYFDGDGCVWNGKRKKMVVKDSTRKEGFRERIVHNVKFTFTGNLAFINELLDILVNLKIVNKKTKLNLYAFRGREYSEEVYRPCTMEYSGRKQLKKLFDYMYSNASIYGKRKYDKFLEIFSASGEQSSEDISLNAGTPETEISSRASDINSVEGSSTIPEMGVESSDSKYETPNNNLDEDIVSSHTK